MRFLAAEESIEADESFEILNRTDLADQRGQPHALKILDSRGGLYKGALRTGDQRDVVAVARKPFQRHQHDLLGSAKFEFGNNVDDFSLHHDSVNVAHPRQYNNGSRKSSVCVT